DQGMAQTDGGRGGRLGGMRCPAVLGSAARWEKNAIALLTHLGEEVQRDRDSIYAGLFRPAGREIAWGRGKAESRLAAEGRPGRTSRSTPCSDGAPSGPASGPLRHSRGGRFYLRSR